MKIQTSLLIIGLLSAPAWADDITPSGCKAPIIPGTQASQVTINFFNKHQKEYKACISKFVGEQQEIAKTSTDHAVAAKAFGSSEAAVKEFNAFMEEVNERDRAAGKEDDDDDDNKSATNKTNAPATPAPAPMPAKK